MKRYTVHSLTDELADVVGEIGADPTDTDATRYLQDVIDQYRGATEKLRAAHEGIRSGNEALQSTPEELETSQDEVQSTHEELTVLNEALRQRNRDLAAVSADLANFVASTQIPIVIVDGTLRIRRYTPASGRVMTITPNDIGRQLGELQLRIGLLDIETRIAVAIATLEAVQVDVQDDQSRWWSLTIRPYFTVDHSVDGAVLIFTDIDSAKRYGQQAERRSEIRRMLLIDAEAARAEAYEANRAKTSFLANMSHDLRTPLNAVLGYVDILEFLVHGPLTTNQKDDVTRIKRSARHLLSLINDILNFATIETGALDLQIDTVSVNSAVVSLEAMIYPQLVAKGLSFTHRDCDLVVRADPEKMQQVLLNLMTNAIKFTPAGGITIQFSQTETTVTIEIVDTGIGIAADQLDRIFEPFIQVDRSLTSVSNDGVGLGLAISRNLARAMNGELTVQSLAGQGSTFGLVLPRVEALS